MTDSGPAAQTGLDLLNMADLSPLQKVILRIVLRKVRISEPDLITTACNRLFHEARF